MSNLKAGVAWALMGCMLIAPLSAAGQSKGYLSGDARSEAKQPYADYSVRARSVTDGTIQGTTILDAQGNFLLEGLTTGKFIVELTRTGQNKVLCSEGPFDLKPGAAADTAFGKGEISIKCNQPVAAWLLLAGAAAAGVTAGVVATGNPASPAQ